MIEYGTVVELKDGKAIIEAGTTGLCGYCGACTCSSKGKMRAEADAPPGVAVGDRVEFDVPMPWRRVIVCRYILPVCAVIAGLLLGRWLTAVYFPHTGYPGLPGIVLALGLVILTYLGTYLYGRWFPPAPAPLTLRKVTRP